MQRLTCAPALPRRSYRPEQRACPSCQRTLTRSHILWRKRLLTLSGPVQVTSWGYRCPNAACPTAAIVYRSAAAEGLHLRKHQFSREVLVQVGYRRFWYHQTIYQIHSWLTQDLRLAVSARQVAHLVADFLALLQAAQPAKIRATLQPLKSLIVGVDGMQPAKGDTSLYIVRELQTDVTLAAENLDDSCDTTIRTRLLQPLHALAQELGLPWAGIVSDAQDTLRTAIRAELPAVPHQACQSHCLRAAGALTFETDRTLKKQLKAAFRSALKRVEQRIAELPSTDLFRPILADYAAALRATLLEGGVAPFELGGIHIFDDLTAVAASLEHCRKKGGLRPCCAACAKSPIIAWPMPPKWRNSAASANGCSTGRRCWIRPRAQTSPRRPVRVWRTRSTAIWWPCWPPMARRRQPAITQWRSILTRHSATAGGGCLRATMCPPCRARTMNWKGTCGVSRLASGASSATKTCMTF